MNNKEISIYIHWPYCLMKCPYCDFNSFVASNPIEHVSWEQAYENIINMYLPVIENRPIKSIFFGGGTPSTMEPQTVLKIIEKIKKISTQEIKEITLEANPSTFEYPKFKEFKEAGVNRLSIGIQSFNNKNLEVLGRNHNSSDAIEALEIAKSLFEKYSFDLIMGLPKQSLEEWKEDLHKAIPYINGHISIYQLTIEPGTAFYRKKVLPAADEHALSMYLYNIQELEKINIHQYEVSNFAKKGDESIHNLNYWEGGEYIGIGPGAHGRFMHNNIWYASEDIKNPKKWLNVSCQETPTDLITWDGFKSIEIVNQEERKEEIILTSLRINQPIPEYILKQLDEVKIKQLIEINMMRKNDKNQTTLTQEGMLCLNQVISYLLT